MKLRVQEILNSAMALTGVLDADEAPSASDYARAKIVANIMISRWSINRLLLRSTSSLTVPLQVGRVAYTVAPSGAYVTAEKPLSVESAFVRDSASMDTPVSVITVEEYNRLQDKTTSPGEVLYVTYDPGAAQQAVNTGTFFVYHAPAVADTLFLEVDNTLSSFGELTSWVTFEDCYYEALVYNLALRLFRHDNGWAKPVPEDIVNIAVNSLRDIQNLNSEPLSTVTDLPGVDSSRINILTES